MIFLCLVAVPGIVWSFRCDRQSPHYKFPTFAILPPAFVGGIYAAQHLL
jgi:hypothetical protein